MAQLSRRMPENCAVRTNAPKPAFAATTTHVSYQNQPGLSEFCKSVTEVPW
jgi:hypothetical protein